MVDKDVRQLESSGVASRPIEPSTVKTGETVCLVMMTMMQSQWCIGQL